MVLLFDDDVYTSSKEGARLLAKQAEKAKTTVQIASMDGSNTAWTRLNAPGLLLVSRGKTVRISGQDLDDLITVCKRDGDFIVGHPSSSD
jgi:hypothetical protein